MAPNGSSVIQAMLRRLEEEEAAAKAKSGAPKIEARAAAVKRAAASQS
jgi:Arc/MetJ-type ribon-helix-helix transcriptional regulator